MNNLINPNLLDFKTFKSNMEKMMAEIEKMNTDALRNIFKNDIKESFLISILSKIKKDHPDISKYYQNALNISLENQLQGNTDQIDYDICNHIVGNHKFNTLFMSDDERGSLQRDNKYIDKLCNQVFENIKLRNYGSSFFRNKAMFPGDKFLYFPLGYDIFVISMYLVFEIENPKVKQMHYYPFYLAMLNQITSLLTLIENGMLTQAYPQYRNLIELYFKYEVLLDSEDGMKAYQKFIDYEIQFIGTGKFPEKFLKEYEKIDNKDVSKLDYLHFGWIDSMFAFNYLGKEKQYSITGLVNYLNMDGKKAYIEKLKFRHNLCHTFSHGSTIMKSFPLQSYFEQMPTLYIILTNLLDDIVEVIERKKPILNGINLADKLQKDIDEFNLKSKLVNVQSITNYYKNFKKAK